MKGIKRFLWLLLISFFLVFSACDSGVGGNEGSSDDDLSSESVKVVTVEQRKSIPLNESFTFISDMQIGWNLGNALDANNNGVSSETAWGNPKITQTLLTKVKEAGFQVVRIPITWLGHIGSAPKYTIEESFLDRVSEVVGYAKNAGLKAIINIAPKRHTSQ